MEAAGGGRKQDEGRGQEGLAVYLRSAITVITPSPFANNARPFAALEVFNGFGPRNSSPFSHHSFHLRNSHAQRSRMHGYFDSVKGRPFIINQQCRKLLSTEDSTIRLNVG